MDAGVAVARAVDELERVVEVVGADDGEHRAEELLAGELGLAGSIVSTIVGPSIGAGGSARPSRRRARPRRRLPRRARSPRRPARACLGRDDRADVGRLVAAGADRQLGGGVDERVAHVVLARASPTSTATRAGQAALAGGAEGRPDDAATISSRSASGMTTIEFFAPPRACTACRSRRSGRRRSRAVVAEPTNEIASIPGWSSIPLTASRPPWTRLKTPAGIASIASISSKIRSRRCRVALGRLEDERVPTPIAKPQEPERDHRRGCCRCWRLGDGSMWRSLTKSSC